MPDDLVIARNPDPDSALPFLVRIPLGGDEVVVKTRQAWPRATKVYCHRVADWPADAEVIERLPLRSVSRRGAAIDLVLTRARENRSQLVLTRARGREVIFWQTALTTKQARPRVQLSRARAHGQALEIVVDTGERYAYSFTHQQASIVRRRLPAGDYAVWADEDLLATVERKSAADLAGSLLSGRLTYQMADLASWPRAAVVVESGYGKLLALPHHTPGQLAEGVAEAQARYPNVPIVFCENRKLAEEWTYRWLGACLAEHSAGDLASDSALGLGPAADRGPEPDSGLDSGSDSGPDVAPDVAQEESVRPEPAAATIRAWAREAGLDVPARGRLPAAVVESWQAAHRGIES